MDRQPLTDRLGDKLLAEYGGAAAAYSLRSLSGDQTKVVRVRRSSDNAEKDFTASEMGAALEDWVNEIQTLGAVSNSVGNDGFTLTNASSTGFTATTETATGVCGWLFTAKAGDKITVSFDAVVRSGTPQFIPRRATALSSNSLVDVVSDEALAVDSTGSYSFEFTYDSDEAGSLTFSEGDDYSDFDISNFQVTNFKGTGFVETWYDQSGNGNDATQTVAASQPKIVSDGSLIVDGINFFSGLNLKLSDTGLDLFKNVSYGQIFSVIKPRETNTASNRYFEATVGTGSGARFLLADGQDTAGTFRLGGRRLDGDSFGDEESPTGHSNQLSLITGFLNYTDAEGFLFLNGAQVATNSIPNMTAGNTSDTSSQSVAIGGASAGNTSPFNAKEFIIYNSDQSANRTAIEANINNHYSIY